MDPKLLQRELLDACREGNIDEVRDIIKSGADVNAKSPFGVPLQIAVESGNFALSKLLVENGADVNGNCRVRINLYSYAQIAALGGYDEILEYLLSKGADINYKSARKWSLLDCTNNRVSTIKLLLSRQSVTAYQEGATPKVLNSAAAAANFELCKLLLENGAKASDVDQSGRGPLNFLVDNIIKNNPSSAEERVRVAKLLVENGADINVEGTWEGHIKPIDAAKKNADKDLYDYFLSLSM